MNYTAEDIKMAKELKAEGYNWVIKNFNLSISAFEEEPPRCMGLWFEPERGKIKPFIEYLGFLPITVYDEKATRLDDIIATEKLKEYERLTHRDLAVTLHEDRNRFLKYAQRLWELEKKIESGELVFREVEE